MYVCIYTHLKYSSSSCVPDSVLSIRVAKKGNVIGPVVREIHSLGKKLRFVNRHFISNMSRAKIEVCPGALVIEKTLSPSWSMEKNFLEEVMLKHLYFEG